MKKVSFVIPCYNSEKFLENTVNSLLNVIKEQKNKFESEIILINDSSKDNTVDKIEILVNKNKNIIGIDLARNFGQHSAIMSGINLASGDIIICLDDDGQTPPEEVIKLINAIDDDTDVVYAKYKNKQHSKCRNWGSKINDYMAESLLNKPKSLYISSFFAMKKYVKEEILKYDNPYPYLEGLVLRCTNRIRNVEVEHKERKIGKSNYNFKKLLSLWVNGFTSFSVKPLRIAIAFSLFFVALALVMSIIVVINKINNPDVPIGWSSIVICTLMIGAVITFILGLIGEYIGRIYLSINNNPQYVIRKVIKNEKN
mgnify:CR=1 FL=1